MGIPRPPTPWSPIPRIRSPSVTTITSTCGFGRCSSSEGIESREGRRCKKAARSSVNVAKFLAAERDHRSVDHRHHLFHVVQQQPVKQHLVGVLERS